MSEGLELSDETLLVAGSLLVAAARTVVEGGAAAPREVLLTATGIGEQLRWFLQAVTTARGSLADASVTASQAVATVMRHSGELDAQLASAVSGGFAVAQTRRPKS